MERIFNGLAHIGLFTDDYEMTMHFYTKQLPFGIVKETVEDHPGDISGYYPMKWALIELDGLYLEIMQCANKACVENGVAGTFNHLGISVSNLEQAIAELKSKGIEEERFEPVVVNDQLFPGHVYRSCRLKGANGAMIGLYEMDNHVFLNF